jgi:arabinofuranosyltransferase
MSKQNLFLISMLAAATMMLGMAWMSDDAFITLRVIDNLVNGYGLRFNVIERVQVFTHPLWLMFLTPFYALTHEPLLTPMLLSVALSLGALWILAARISTTLEYGSILVLAAAASRVLSSFSSSGLETPLTFLLLALFVWQFVRPDKIWIASGIAGLMLLNRLDLLLLLAPVMGYLVFRARGFERTKVALAAILPAFLWMGFSIIYYGSAFPNTAYAKLGSGYDTGTLILRGLEYAKDFVLTDPLLAMLIAYAIFIALRSRDRASAFLGIGIILYISYTITIGGDFMSGRFFAPPGFLALCILARNPASHWLLNKLSMKGLVIIEILGFLLVARIVEQPINSAMIPLNGIGDERRFYYVDTGLLPLLEGWLATGLKPVPPWGQRGLALKTQAEQNGSPIAVGTGTIGMRGYYAGPRVHIVDDLALSDAFLARLPAVYGARVGHYRRLLPPGYAETVINDIPTTDNSALSPLLNDVTLATRAPLLADGRWNAIWHLSSGYYKWIYETDSYGLKR